MARLRDDFEEVARVFRLLSNPGNIELLAVLSSGEFNPRELARLLGRDETDVSRRLRRLERMGLVSAEWRRVSGRNIRVYKLRGSRLCLRISKKGVGIESGGEGVDPAALARRLGPVLAPPRSSSWFVGREKELAVLESSPPGLLVVVGLPGSGKTSLLATHASKLKSPVAWYTVTGYESLTQLLWRISLFAASLGDTSLYERLGAGDIGVGEAARLLADILDKYGAVLVLDDFHRVSDKHIAMLVAEAAPMLTEARIIVASRRKPTSLLAEVPGAQVLSLGGLSPREARELLARLGVELDAPRLSMLYAATQGYPLLLKLFAELAASKGVDEALRLLHERRLGTQFWDSIVAGLSASERQVLELLVDLEIPVPAELVADTCSCKAPVAALYRLLDLGLVTEAGGGYVVRDIVLRTRPRRPRLSSLLGAGEWFVKRPRPDHIVAALHLFRRAGDERKIVRTIRTRIARIGHEMALVRDTYGRELEEALESTRSDYARAYLLAELALVARERGDYDGSLELLRKAWMLTRMYRDSCLLLNIVGHLLWHYPLKLGGGEAEELLREAEKILGNSREDPCLLGAMDVYYSNLARYYAMRGEVGEALSAIRLGLSVAEKRGNPREVAFSRAQLALVLGMMGRLEEAIAEAEEALGRLLLDAPEPLLARVKWILAELYLRAGNIHGAYRYAYEAREAFMKQGHYSSATSTMAVEVLSLIKMGSYSTAYRVAKELKSIVEEKIGSWNGSELDGLAVAAAYQLAGRDARRFAEELIEARRKRAVAVSPIDAAPYIEALRAAGLDSVADRLAELAKQL
ncbi:hypothetical protein PYJP_06700 [Pyrofollis japonicus]|uniref:AAA family ATPase n=1 Tax=Pyrofollis japonicus TaxID=3060460 RepID=UPI00295A7002|nr:AAA family ATPase [Pyrofollis japonicus]BEP17318.1 hypothetical protein PYJP_06700 [Pyrofollis japonicus]